LEEAHDVENVAEDDPQALVVKEHWRDGFVLRRRQP
jgi:hypothetical protein